MHILDLVACILSLGFVIQIYRRLRRDSSLPLPPGPKKLPFVGNLLDLPTSCEWETYARWGEEYNSELIHITVAGIDIIIVNSAKIANDLFEKRSSIYSSRPQFTMANELMGWGWFMSTMPYGEPWKERRRLFTRNFPPANDLLHRPREVEFVHRMMMQILERPNDVFDLTRHTVGGIALSLAYGLNIRPWNDPYIELAEKALRPVEEASIPGAFLVDILPWLKYIPEWVPGAGFQKKARIARGLQQQFHNKPYDDTIKALANGSAQASFTSLCLDSLDDSSDHAHQHEVIKDTAGMFFGGAAGSDTTISALHTFILTMLCFPEVLTKAQREIDQVVGRGRLPEFSDEGDLPYLSAIIKETMRWRAVTPIGVPHQLSEDDVYRGYHLPAKSIVVGNAWAMLNNENDYPCASDFKPERFLKGNGQLNPNVRDPMSVAFGFGRRECPGKHIALSTLWLAAASILSVFEINKAVDGSGRIIAPDLSYHLAIVCHPEPFKCTLKPRSTEAERLIRSLMD